MTSFASTNGPSVTEPALYRAPPGLRPSPTSMISLSNFDFQAFQAANIACISSGDGGFEGVAVAGVRYRYRNFVVAMIRTSDLGSAAALRRALLQTTPEHPPAGHDPRRFFENAPGAAKCAKNWP